MNGTLAETNKKSVIFGRATVDGRIHSPVEVGSLSHHLLGFIHPRWLFGISSIKSIFLAQDPISSPSNSKSKRFVARRFQSLNQFRSEGLPQGIGVSTTGVFRLTTHGTETARGPQ